MTASSRPAFVAAALFASLLAGGCAGVGGPGPNTEVKRVIAGPAGRLHVDDGGAGGLPVVFVHSFAGSGDHWRAQLDHLRRTRRAVALDLRGHGGSEPPRPDGYSVPMLASDIGAAVDALGRFVLVGHSMGGAASIDYSGTHPDRVAALVLVGTPGKSPPGQSAKIMASMQADFEKVSDGYWKTLLSDARPAVEQQIRGEMKRLPRDAQLAIIGAVFAYDPLPALNAYRGPTLIVDTPHGDGPAALHTQAPAIPRRVIGGTSHWPQLDKPDEFNRILDELLVGLR